MEWADDSSQLLFAYGMRVCGIFCHDFNGEHQPYTHTCTCTLITFLVCKYCKCFHTCTLDMIRSPWALDYRPMEILNAELSLFSTYKENWQKWKSFMWNMIALSKVNLLYEKRCSRVLLLLFGHCQRLAERRCDGIVLCDEHSDQHKDDNNNNIANGRRNGNAWFRAQIPEPLPGRANTLALQ